MGKIIKQKYDNVNIKNSGNYLSYSHFLGEFKGRFHNKTFN